jgi:drug/metabolite transporter (DMT)-like permease
VLGLLAGVANGAALAAMFECARHLRLSVMAPIGAAGGAVPVVVALLLGERPAVWQLAGIPSRSRAWSSSRRVSGAVRAPTRRAGTGRAGCGWPRRGRCSTASSSACSRRRPRAGTRASAGRLSRSAIPLVTLNGLLILGGVTAFAAATSAGLVSVVSVLARLSPLVTVALAIVLLRERLGGSQQVGLATATAGVVLLAAG